MWSSFAVKLAEPKRTLPSSAYRRATQQGRCRVHSAAALPVPDAGPVLLHPHAGCSASPAACQPTAHATWPAGGRWRPWQQLDSEGLARSVRSARFSESYRSEFGQASATFESPEDGAAWQRHRTAQRTGRRTQRTLLCAVREQSSTLSL